MSNISLAAARLFTDAANAVETGRAAAPARVAVTGLGSELGEKAVADACSAAVSKGCGIYYLGTVSVPGAVNIRCDGEDACHAEMNRLLQADVCDAAVTMHALFPIGTATVGRVITPSRGKEMFIATTTGAPSSDRNESLVLGAIYGIIAAKACGYERPGVGLLNIDGARRAETSLRKLRDQGFPLDFVESARKDGGALMRGNDVLLGTPDVLVCDPLTGNTLMKMLSAYSSGGDRECSGYGYGPGIGTDMKSPVLIVSRASDTPVILNAVRYAAEICDGGISEICAAVLGLAEKCGLHEILRERKEATVEKGADAAPPARVPVTESIPGIEAADVEDAERLLRKNGVYAEGAMGCTGPVIMVSSADLERAKKLLREAGYISD